MEILVEDASGNVQGDGPITTAIDWTYTERLDKADTFQVGLPAAEPRTSLLAPYLRLHCIDWLPGEIETDYGYGVIDQIGYELATPDQLTVTGGGRLRELAGISVGDLDLSQVDTESASSVWAQTSLTATELPEAHDANPATYASLTLDFDGWLYIYSPETFEWFDVTMGPTVNSSHSLFQYQFFNGDTTPAGSWDDLSILENTTLDAGHAFHQDGRVRFDAPHGWDALTDGYPVRVRCLDGACALDIAEITISNYGPVADALATLIALATGWSLDIVNGYAATLGTVMWRFAGESLLTALIKVAQLLGEHFRLGTGKSIVWLQKDTPDSGLYAINDPPDSLAYQSTANAVQVLSLSHRRDASTLISQLYPHGGGVGKDRVTLEYTDRTLPTGYSWLLDGDGKKAGIRRDATYAWAGRIDDGKQSWADITYRAGTSWQKRNASNTLCDRSLEYLRTHSSLDAASVPVFLALTVSRVRAPLASGMTLYLDIQRYRDGERYIDIRGDFVILSVSWRKQRQSADPGGIAALELGSIDRWPENDDQRASAALEQAAASRAHRLPAAGVYSVADGTPYRINASDGYITSISRVTPCIDGEHAVTDHITTIGGIVTEVI